MNLNTFGGYIKGGDYDVLITHGNAMMREDVTFDTLVVKGILQTTVCRGRRIVMDGGILNSSREIVSDSLSGHGRICAQQHISTQKIAFIGDMETNSRLTVEQGIRVNGSINAKSLVTPRAKITGHTRIAECAETGKLEIKPIHTAMFERFGMNEYLEPSNIQRINATNVVLCNTNCQKIDAGYVALSGHTHVERVIYEGDLRLDKTSSVRLIEHRWDMEDDEDDELQRKVA
ncbi:hypothetical protein OZX62_05645 [Bifidobacterium sp. ESL0690]|uniref:hypothetical protein n=1 Tax=Bifidobacterium sp. ESL0690 TaxID=2983214 RepID=UPI0023F87B35|nr:hypothetical protein [Bifidobacterium sp. ESL0690]WEV45953.1 hypothetical protein OZX62_05645 [Bifidobacterium sp. ESL0690]